MKKHSKNTCIQMHSETKTYVTSYINPQWKTQINRMHTQQHTYSSIHTLNRKNNKHITDYLRSHTNTHKVAFMFYCRTPSHFWFMTTVNSPAFFQTSVEKINCEAQIIYSWDVRCVYSLSYCPGVQLLVCREKTGFLNGSPINYRTIANVPQKRCH